MNEEAKKVCSKCKVEKVLNEFNKAGKNKPGYLSTCKECKSAIKKKWYAEHKEEAKAYNQKWDTENAERRKGKREEWRLSNKESIAQYDRSYKEKKRAINPLYSLSVYLTNRIRDILNCSGKFDNPINYQTLGCSREDFIRHIESQFEEGMNWKNRNSWHLDHIIPISAATTRREVYKLNHYANFRPLWRSDNLSKSNTLIPAAGMLVFDLFKVNEEDDLLTQLDDVDSLVTFSERILNEVEEDRKRAGI
jgi:hypothetical protein